jgi:anthranilate phosphoribosyltransferase
MDLASAIARAVARRDLSADEMSEVVGRIMDGEATQAQIGAFLVALRMKGESVAEVVGAARAMRARALPMAVPPGVIVDTCGTGGDGRGTVNISTLAALVVAAAGVRVAKHGNRAQSSRAGSADLLEALGVDVAAARPVVERCLTEAGIGFLFAPAFHGATRHAAGVRREIAVRTVFNLLGPLTNPAGARYQLLGVYDVVLVEPMARALLELGSVRALVVHGAGGLDEFAPAGVTEVAELQGGAVRRYRLSPADFGLDEADAAELQGGDPAENARVSREILDGGGPRAVRSAVVMSAAGALYVAGAASLTDGARRAEQLLDDGSARRTLERLVAISRASAAVEA